MTAKEKALEIFNRYHNLDIEPYSEFGNFICKDSAKQCALIAVDELVASFRQLSIEDSGSVFRDFGYRYWEEVRLEIELL